MGYHQSKINKKKREKIKIMKIKTMLKLFSNNDVKVCISSLSKNIKTDTYSKNDLLVNSYGLVNRDVIKWLICKDDNGVNSCVLIFVK